jgi:hypothetical protein
LGAKPTARHDKHDRPRLVDGPNSPAPVLAGPGRFSNPEMNPGCNHSQ